MNKELQDLAWSVLPKEFKEEVKKEYHRILNGSWSVSSYLRGRLRILREIFGIHNLTSDNEKISEPKPSEPRFKVGDKVVVSYCLEHDKIGRIQEVLYDGCYDVDYGGGCTGHPIIEGRLEPYTEPEEESRNLSQETAICDKQFDNILKDSFRSERRLNIATQILSSILSNQRMLNNLAHGETTVEDVVKCVINATMMYTDALIAECEEGGKS